MPARELVEYIAKALVDDPDAVEVNEAERDESILELRVATEDRGKVIGRKGRTAHAIRVLLGACGDSPKSLDIVDY